MSLKYGFNKPWHQDCFVKLQNAGKAGVHSNCLRKRERTTGGDLRNFAIGYQHLLPPNAETCPYGTGSGSELQADKNVGGGGSWMKEEVKTTCFTRLIIINL